MDGRALLNRLCHRTPSRGAGLLCLCLLVVLLDGCGSSSGRRYRSRRSRAATPARTEEARQEAPVPATAVEEEPAPVEAPIPAVPEVTREPVSAPSRPAFQPPAGRSGSGDRALRVLDLLEGEKSARQVEAAELVKDAENHLLNFEILKAEEKLDMALRLDPANETAQRLMVRVRMELGDRRGEVPQIRFDLTAEQRAIQGATLAELNILLNQGQRLDEEGEHEKAIENYQKAIEVIRSYPHNLRAQDRLRLAREKLARSQSLLKEKQQRDRVEFEKKLRDIRESERRLSLIYEENRLAEVRRKAKEAFAREEYDVAIENAEQVLAAYPEDLEARRMKSVALERQKLQTRHRIFVDTVHNHRLALLGLRESAVIYQEIFRYPPKREWERIGRKVANLEERFAASETEVEREIKRKLQEPQDIGFPEAVPFEEAIALIRQLSGINIILNKAAKEAVDAEGLEVQLARVRDLPLENVLRLILRQSGDNNFDFSIGDGAIIIGTRDSLEKQWFLHFYDIHDITQPHPDFPAPKLALDEAAGQDQDTGAIFDIGGDEEERGGGQIGPEKLIELLEKEITDEAGEVPGNIKFQRGKLAVRTTLENHRKVNRLLEEFRKATGIMVTVESRFLTIQDNFLEEIGVDIGSGSNTFLLNSIPDIDGAGTSISPGYEFLNAQRDVNVRAASIGTFSNPLGSQVNPFNITAEGGVAYQLNVLTEQYQLEALLTAVGKTQEIRRLASPRVTAFNTQIAHTLVIDQAAYIKDLEVNQTGVIPVINPVIGVLNTGSILEVRPNVSHDQKYIILEIQPTLAEQLDSEVALLNLSGNFTQVPVELPVTSVTKLKTTVTVPDGGTVLLGGMKKEFQSKSSLGIPGLRHIPVLNLLFGRKGQSVLRSNLFVLINAKITVVQEEEDRLFNI